MEFDEMKKIWDAQTNQPLYVIDEKALHDRIQRKMSGEYRLASMREWSTILFYLGAVGVMLGFNSFIRFKPGASVFVYLGAAWMFGTVVYIVVSRTRRIKASRRFDRSIHGDLDYAIWLARYQMHLSLVIGCNFLPLGTISILFSWEVGGLFMACVVVILVSAILTFYVERKGFRASKKRKQALQVLKGKLESGR
jgi:hypothetical protein